MRRQKHKNDKNLKKHRIELGMAGLFVWPDRLRGCWSGIKEHRIRFNRKDRREARESLRKGVQPADSQPRGRAKWEV